MSNKKAIVLSVLIAIIVAIIAGMFIMLLFGNIAEATGAGAMVDSMCKFNTAMIGKFKSGQALMPLMFCPERTVTIDATDWDKCNAELYKPNIARGRELCASQQILNLMDRCWYMYGDGKGKIAGLVQGWRGGACFKFKVKHLSKDSNILNANMIKTVAQENTNLRTGQSYCSAFDCTSDKGEPMKRVIWPPDSSIKSDSGYWRIKYLERNQDLGGSIQSAATEWLTGKSLPLLLMGPAA